MTRKLLAGTTAIALALSPIASSLTAVSAEIRLAQAQGSDQAAETSGKKEKVGKKGSKDETAETCKDGSAPPCAAEEAGAPAAEGTEPAQAGTEAEPAASEEAAEGKGRKKKKDRDEAEAEQQPAEAASENETAAEPSAAEPAGTEAKSETAADSAQQEPVETAEEADPAGETEDPDTTGANAEAESPGKSDEAKVRKKKKAEESEAAESGEPQAEPQPQAAGAGTETRPADSVEAGAEPKEPAVEAQEDSTAEQPADETAESETKRKKKAERREAKEEPVQPPAAATAAEGGAPDEPVNVTSETVTEETTRTSDEEVEEATAERRKKKKDKDDDDLLKILGAAAGGLAGGVIIGSLLKDGGEVVDTTGDRVIIERDGQYFVRKDENEILRRPGSTVQTETFHDGSSRTVVERADGSRVVTIRDQYGYVVRRSRILPDGREILLFDDIEPARDAGRIEERDLPPLYYDTLPQARYVDYSHADRHDLRETLMAPPVAEVDRSFSLRQVREIRELRDLVPALDLDTITFDSGSAAISYDQALNLDDLGRTMEDILAENPDEVFLIEGHTDAVGSRVYNLALSDRRAETVALALTEYYDIPPENLITQGYGEEYLKIDTELAERANRRVTVRRITPLLDRQANLR